MQQFGSLEKAQPLQLGRGLVRTGDGIVDVGKGGSINLCEHLASSGLDHGDLNDAAAYAPLAPNELMHLRTLGRG